MYFLISTFIWILKKNSLPHSLQPAIVSHPKNDKYSQNHPIILTVIHFDNFLSPTPMPPKRALSNCVLRNFQKDFLKSNRILCLCLSLCPMALRSVFGSWPPQISSSNPFYFLPPNCNYVYGAGRLHPSVRYPPTCYVIFLLAFFLRNFHLTALNF